MDDFIDTELVGRAPSFQEFLAAEHAERSRFLDAYMASRGIAPLRRNREALAAFLERAGGELAGNALEAERVLDAYIRVRPERLAKPRSRSRRGVR